MVKAEVVEQTRLASQALVDPAKISSSGQLTPSAWYTNGH